MVILIVYILLYMLFTMTATYLKILPECLLTKVSTKFAKYGMSLGYCVVNNRLAMLPTSWMTMNDTILVLEQLLIRSFLKMMSHLIPIRTLFGMIIAITSQ